METPPLDELMEFPSSYTFRAVAATLPGLPQACATAVENALGRAPDKVSAQPSSKGKWTSVRVTAQVHSADEWIDLDDFERACDLVLALVEQVESK